MVMFIFSITASVNYTVDPFDIFHTSILKHQNQLNERFAKVEFLDKNNKKFNSYMFGSSRIGTTFPSTVEQYIPNSKFYNFTVASANLYDYLMHLKYLIKKGYPIDNLYLQLDIENMNQYGKFENIYYKKLHPYVLDESLLWFYTQHLIGIFPMNIKGKINKNLHFNYDNRTEYFLDIGMWTKPGKEKHLIEDCKTYIKNEPKFHINYKRNTNYTTSSTSIKALSEIKSICMANGIKLYIFITPHNQNMMDKFVIDDYLKYIKDISKVVDFYDFSGYNSVTTNNCNYYEISHYRPHVGELIAARIFNNRSVDVPNDFGIFVNKNNIHAHLNKLKEEIASYELRKEHNSNKKQ
jgi:hypothetical protein